MTKRHSNSKSSKKLQAFNRTQEIYRLLQRGIIESEALFSNSGDRPEEDAHISDLLNSAAGPAQPRERANRRSRKSAKRAKPKRKKRR